MNKNRSKLYAAWLLALCIGVAPFASSYRQRAPDLMRRATLLPQSQDRLSWRERTWTGPPLSEHEELLVEGKTSSTITRHDLATGKSTPMTALTRLFLQGRQPPYFSSSDFKVSRDGRRLLWYSGTDHRYRVASLDADRVLDWPMRHSLPPNNSPVFYGGDYLDWIDNQRWIAVENGKGNNNFVSVYDITHPFQVKTLPIKGNEGYHNDGRQRKATIETPEHHFLLYTSELRKSVSSDARSKGIKDVYETDLTVGGPSILRFNWHSPETVSPQRDRCFGETVTYSRPVAASLMHTVFQDPPTNPEATRTLWISRLDGSEKQVIGAYRAADGLNIANIIWMPDGKRLSFTSNGKPYSVPVD